MAVIPHVVAGNTALAAQQNALIDQVNSNTSTVVTVGTGVFTETDTVSAWATATQTTVSNHETRLDTLEAKPWVVLKKTANQSIATGGTDTVVTWQTSTGTTSMKVGDTVVIPTAGAYLLTANVNMQGGGSTVADSVVYIVKNSTTDVFLGSLAAFSQPGNLSTSGVGNGLSTSVVANLAANDVIRVLVWQGSGSARPLRYQDFGGCSFTVSAI